MTIKWFDKNGFVSLYGEHRFPHPLNQRFRSGSETHCDIDSIRIAVSIEALIDFFPTATLGRLCARKGTTPALRQWVLVTEAGGYNCYARLGAAAKHNACEFITRHGPLVHASKNNAIFSTGTISCPLLVTLSGLLNAGVEVRVLEAFGMKSDMALLEQLAEMQVDEPTLEERIDIGISASCSGIPLFSCFTEGKVFPLLHMAGFGNGSVTLERDVNVDTRVRTVVYPTLSHHIKSLLHISCDVPVTMSGIYRKEDPIKGFWRTSRVWRRTSMATGWNCNISERSPCH